MGKVQDMTPEGEKTLLRLFRKPTALQDVLNARLEQIQRWGHSDEADAMLPVTELPRLARDRVLAASEQLALRGRDGLPIARDQLVKAGALILASIDRIDMALNPPREDPGAGGILDLVE